MIILAIDTTNICSVALWNNGSIFTYNKWCYCKQSQYILPLIQKILSQGNINLNEIDALAFNRGPGNLTSTRIGVGIIQGLSLGAKLPIISISSLLTIAQVAWREIGASQVITTINAHTNQIYWAEYIRDKYGYWHGIKTETILKYDEVSERLEKFSNDWVLVGTGCQFLEKKLINGVTSLKYEKIFSEAKDMLPIAYYLLNIGDTVSVEDAQPSHLSNIVF